jgi:hypothetical protein
MPAKPIAAMELGVPAAPTGTHKPADAIASSLLRDSAASRTRRPLLQGFATGLQEGRCHDPLPGSDFDPDAQRRQARQVFRAIDIPQCRQ